MGAYNFKPQFEADIMADRKRHTIRAKRKHPDKPGDTLHLFVGLRTKKARLLKRRQCVRVQDIHIQFLRQDIVTYMLIVIDGGKPLSIDEGDLFARSDGFKNMGEMGDFWLATHGERDFSGDLIYWESDGDYLKRKIPPKSRRKRAEHGAVKRACLEKTRKAMKARYAAGQPKDPHEAFRQGYNARVAGQERKPPFITPELRRLWRKGFDQADNGLRIALPAGAVLFPKRA